MKFTSSLIKRVKSYLERERKQTEKHLKEVAREDPFADPDRLSDNAASDTEAKEEVGHDRVEAIRRELMAKLSYIDRALFWLRKGKYGTCERCHKKIEADRLKIMPQATLCAPCARKKESRQ